MGSVMYSSAACVYPPCGAAGAGAGGAGAVRVLRLGNLGQMHVGGCCFGHKPGMQARAVGGCAEGS